MIINLHGRYDGHNEQLTGRQLFINKHIILYVCDDWYMVPTAPTDHPFLSQDGHAQCHRTQARTGAQ